MADNVRSMTPLADALGTAEGRRAEILRRLVLSETDNASRTTLTVLVPETLQTSPDLRQAMVDYVPRFFTGSRGLSFGQVAEHEGVPAIPVFLEGDVRSQYQMMMHDLDKAETHLTEQRNL